MPEYSAKPTRSAQTHTASHTQDCWARAAGHCVLGVAIGLMGGWMMNAFTRVISNATNGHEATGVAPGVKRIGRGMQPPQAEVDAENDAAVRVGTLAYRVATGHRPPHAVALRLGSAAHYGFSAALGVCYLFLVSRIPALARGGGVLYGSLVWLCADEGLMPAFGLSRGPRELSAGMHLYSLVGHWVYGATLESTRQLTRRLPLRELAYSGR
jgi:uncharacterized membrane protein YagU involved in acid resistance